MNATQDSQTTTITFDLYKPEHYRGLKALMQVCFSGIENCYIHEKEMNRLAELYHRGQIVCLADGKVVGANLARIVPYSTFCKAHTVEECNDSSRFELETAIGDSVYGLDVLVHPEYQNLKIGKQMVDIMFRNAFEDNFRCTMGISRVANYANHIHEMDCATYASKVKTKELYDPCLSFHLRNGMEYVNVSPDFWTDDLDSAGFGVIVAIYNPDFDPQLPIYPERERVLGQLCVA